MKKLLKYIISSTVDHPESVKIEEKTTDEEVLLKLSVHPEDMGKVIGKGGKIIRAIRQLTHILATKRKKRFNLELVESQNSEKRFSLPTGIAGRTPSKLSN